MDSPFYPIIWRLRELLAATEAMLHGGGEGRAAACHAFYGASLHSLVHVVGVSQTEDADFWALRQENSGERRGVPPRGGAAAPGRAQEGVRHVPAAHLLHARRLPVLRARERDRHPRRLQV